MVIHKNLLIIANTPSSNTTRMVNAILKGAQHEDIEGITATHIEPLKATPEDVLKATAIILGTTENLGYLSGALKDFFDRCYYPCLEKTQGLPYCLYIRAGHDGTGAKRATQSIVTGLRWREVHKPLVCKGDFQESFIAECEELGMFMAAGLESCIF
jgi:multimeric flavodoxin WrbA